MTVRQADPRLVARMRGEQQVAVQQVGVPVVTDVQLLAHMATSIIANRSCGVGEALTVSEDVLSEIFDRLAAHCINHLPTPSRREPELDPVGCFYCRAIQREQNLQDKLTPQVVAPPAGIVSPLQ